MSLPFKGDVKNHLSSRARDSKRLYRSVGPSDASGFLQREATSNGATPATDKLSQRPASLQSEKSPS